LLGVADLVGYASRHVADIDWERISRQHPRVTNLLRLVHLLQPLPASLRFLLGRTPDVPAESVGRGPEPLGSLSRERRSWTGTVSALVYPSEWWMRGYYAVEPGRGLGVVRWGRHVPRLAFWIARRLLACNP
jgi:hypothetical protein